MRKLGLLLTLMLLAAGCAGSDLDERTRDALDTSPSPTAKAPLGIKVVSPPEGDRLAGNTIEIGLETTGIEIVKADGDTSGNTGHFHVFIDREPVAPGEAIPRAADVVHSATNPVVVTGIPPGTHEFTVVLGDGNHNRIGDVASTISVAFRGPSIEATAPATIRQGDTLRIDVKATGMSVVAPPQGKNLESGHFHALIDLPLPEYGKAIETKEGVIHFSSGSVEIPGLTPGEHQIFIVAGDGGHTPFRPLVADLVTVNVT